MRSLPSPAGALPTAPVSCGQTAAARITLSAEVAKSRANDGLRLVQR